MQSWNRIENWLGAKAPDLLAALSGPASAESFRKLELATQLTLPSDARASYFRHDGQIKEAPPVLGRWWLLKLETSLATWSGMRESQAVFDAADPVITTAGAVRKRYWNPRWVPVMFDGTGDFLCLDLDPAPGGRRGQVVWFQKTSKRREVLTPSLDAWLERFAGELERGQWQVGADGLLAKVEVAA